MSRCNGFSLWELMWTVALAGVMLALAVPSFTKFSLDSRLTADVNALVLAIQVARSEAAKRGQPVVLCSTADQWQCGTGSSFTAGWMVFVDEGGTRPPNRSAEEPLLFAHAPEIDGTVTANRDWFEFRPYGRRSVNGSIVFCDRRGTLAARAVIVSYTGRPRVDTVAADGKPLRCAAAP